MKIHCIGIGGIGVSALAQYYLSEGHEVSGFDLAASEVTDFLRGKGMHITTGKDSHHVKPGMDLIVHSPAVPHNNPELVQAQKLGIAIKSYPEALGELTKKYKTIAVSGSHGKSTTTAMVALILERAGLDPTVIVGTKLKEYGGTNFRRGTGEYLVIEACEYDGSFLQYQPYGAVVTNVDKEHLDYFKTFANVKKAFAGFIAKIPAGGFLVYNGDDKNIPLAGAERGAAKRNFSGRQAEAGRMAGALRIPGKHNVANALAALEAARALGVDDAISFRALAAFRGTWRRFEVKKGSVGGKSITVISDYAHHPAEVAVTLQAAREKYPEKTIWLLFQPHQRARTRILFNDFVRLFRAVPADHVIITDVYDVAGRETKQKNPRELADYLVKKIARKNTEYAPFSKAVQSVKARIGRGDVLIIMGAGDVYRLFEEF